MHQPTTIEPALFAQLNANNILKIGPVLEDQGITTLDILSLLTDDDIKDLVPQLGPRKVLQSIKQKYLSGQLPDTSSALRADAAPFRPPAGSAPYGGTNHGSAGYSGGNGTSGGASGSGGFGGDYGGAGRHDRERGNDGGWGRPQQQSGWGEQESGRPREYHDGRGGGRGSRGGGGGDVWGSRSSFGGRRDDWNGRGRGRGGSSPKDAWGGGGGDTWGNGSGNSAWDSGKGSNDAWGSAPRHGRRDGGFAGDAAEEPPKPRALSEFKDMPEDELYQQQQDNNLDESDLPVQVWGDEVPPSANTFLDMSLPQSVMDALQQMRWRAPMVIQRHTVPSLSICRNVMGCAQTGSGKTGAFLLPIIKWLSANASPPGQPRALILLPTRELAQQVYNEARKLTIRSSIRSCVVFGSARMATQREDIQRSHIVIGTPGRVLMLVRGRDLPLRSLKFLILDEADRMLDEGFGDDVRQLLNDSDMPPRSERCIGLFSAVLDESVVKLAKEFVEQEIFFIVGTLGQNKSIEQQIILTSSIRDKQAHLAELLHADQTLKIVFCSTKRMCQQLADTYPDLSVCLHGDMDQPARERALSSFRRGVRNVLFATDVAARGLDVPGIRLVINFDLPNRLDNYVHRIGRTGRAGHTGKAISFFAPDMDYKLQPQLHRLLRESGQPVPDFMEGGGAEPSTMDWHTTIMRRRQDAGESGGWGSAPSGGYDGDRSSRYRGRSGADPNWRSSEGRAGGGGDGWGANANGRGDGATEPQSGGWGNSAGWGNDAGWGNTPSGGADQPASADASASASASGWGQSDTAGWNSDPPAAAEPAPAGEADEGQQSEGADAAAAAAAAWGSGW